MKIRTENLKYIKAVDTYVHIGHQTSTLAVNADVRHGFYETRPYIKSLLLKEKDNPLLEEGKLTEDKRDRVGEFYLTYEALTFLIEKNIVQHRPAKNSLPYNTKNIYVIKNDLDNLETILENLELKKEDDAKIIYISGIHAIPFYLRNVGSQINCFMVDSEAGVFNWPDEIITVIKKIYPEAKIILSTTLLQKDFFSCSTFAFKAIKYFVKHGKSIFPYLEQVGTKFDADLNCYLLDETKLMPPLLKMCQSSVRLSEETLETVVSLKSKTTLKEYWKAYNFNSGGRNLNSAALSKNYKYFNIVNEYIKGFIKNETTELPEILQRKHLTFSTINTKNAKKTKIHEYLRILKDLDRRSELKSESEEYIALVHKPGFLSKYKEFHESDENMGDSKEYIQIKKLLYIAACSEQKYISNYVEYKQYSQNLYCLFDTFDKCLAYLSKHTDFNAKQPIHDSCLFRLPPTNSIWNKEFWATRVLEFGARASQFLAIAPAIDSIIAKESKDLKPFDLAQIKAIAAQVTYTNYHENLKLAKLCLELKVDETLFEQSLTLIKSGLKECELLPDIIINGSDINEKLKKFKFLKLPSHDIRGFFLGELTACCQSIGKAGAKSAIHGMLSPMSGFYIVVDNKDNIIAQIWTWLGRDGVIVFDSWERTRIDQNYLFEPFIRAAATEMLKYGFRAVHIGRSGNTPDIESFQIADPAIKQRKEAGYSDAKSQKIILCSPYETTLDKFRSFAKKHSEIDASDYVKLFANNDARLEEELSSLITDRKLIIDEFTILCKFLYATGFEVLHANSAKLIYAIVQVYKQQALRFLGIENNEGVSFFDILNSYNDKKIWKDLLNDFIPNDASLPLLATFVHAALEKDSVESMEFFYHLCPAISWKKFVELKTLSSETLLNTAIDKQSLKCIDFILSKVDTVQVLNDVLIGADKNKLFIQKIMEHNNLNLFKFLKKFYESNDNEKLFCDLLSSQVRLYKPEYFLYPVSIALRFNSFELADFILRNFCSESEKLLVFSEYICNQGTVLAYAANNDNLPLLKLIHSHCKNEDDWHKLITHEKYFTNSFGWALKSGPTCAAYIFNSYTSNSCLLELLISTNGEILNYANFKYFKQIFLIYKNNYKSLESLFCDNFGLINTIYAALHSRDVEIFHQLLELFIHKKEMQKYLFHSGNTNSNFLHEMINALDQYNSPYGNFKITTDIILLSFINTFFKFCSPTQIKKNLMDNSNFVIMHRSYPSIECLFETVDKIKDDSFKNDWFLTKTDSHQIPLFHAFLSIDPQWVIPLVIAYYHKNVGKDKTNELLKGCYAQEMLPLLCDRDTHEIGLETLLSLHEDKTAFINKSLKQCIEYSSKRLTKWILSLNVIPLQDVIKYISTSPMNWPSSDTIFAMLWSYCQTKMTKIEQLTFINNNFMQIIKNILFIQNDKELSYKSYSAMRLLHLWFQEYHSNSLVSDFVFKIISQPDNEGLNSFDHAYKAKNETLIELLFLHCNAQQRQELMDRHTKRNVVDCENNPSTLLRTFKKLDVLISLKRDVENYYHNPHCHLFFHLREPERIKRLKPLLLHLDPEKIFGELCDRTTFSIFEDRSNCSIKTIWREADLMLSDIHEVYPRRIAEYKEIFKDINEYIVVHIHYPRLELF